MGKEKGRRRRGSWVWERRRRRRRVRGVPGLLGLGPCRLRGWVGGWVGGLRCWFGMGGWMGGPTGAFGGCLGE